MKKIAQLKTGTIGLAGLGLFVPGLLISLAQPVTGLLAKILLITGGAAMALYLLLDFRAVLAAFSSRRAKAGLMTSAILLLVTGVLVLVYILLGSFNLLRLDFTSNKRFSNSSMTKKVLVAVKEKVTFLIFTQKTPENAPPDAAQMYMMLDGHARGLEFMLKDYNRQNSLIKVQLIDMDEQPLLTKQYNISSPGTVVVSAGKKTLTIKPEDYIKMRFVGRQPQRVVNYEEALTRSLASVTRRRVFTVYFTTGNRELDVNKTDTAGASFARDALVEEGMAVKVTNLLLARGVPADCDLLVMAGPRDALQAAELKSVEDYLLQGGPAIFLAERESPAVYRDLLARWGVTVQPVTVMEPVNHVQVPFLFVPIYPDNHPIVKPILEDNARSLLFTAAVLAPAPPPRDNPFTLEELLSTSKEGWAERDDLSTAKVMPVHNPGERLGSMPLAYAVTRRAAQTKTEQGKPPVREPGPARRVRYVVVGDSDLIGNNIFTRYPGNRLFLVNAAKWAMDIEEQISIPPREEVYKPLQLTDGDLNLIFLVAVVLMPLGIIGLGITVYVRRRLHG